MSKLATSMLFVGLMLLLFVPSPCAKADTGASCPAGGYLTNVTITIQNVNGSFQASPNAVCVTHAATITWQAADSSWKWVVFFLSDGTSPFQGGHRWHDENNPSENVYLYNANCPGTEPCSFTYYGVVIDASGNQHVIDPKVIVNPVAVPGNKRKKKERQ